MCGFAALFESGRNFSTDLLDSIERDLFHRGPDSAGRHLASGVALVFRRLAILDPDPRSDQPFWDGSGRYVIVYNGEIYNYKELQRALSQSGVRLKTNGDTEVIVEGFALWGEEILNKLEGMFAFTIVDTHDNVVYLARDPLGIKPLYIARQGKFLAAASEMHPLRRAIGRTEVDPTALSELLLYRYAGGRLSNLKGIELLQGGTLAKFQIQDGAYSERVFADRLDTYQPNYDITRKQATELIEESISESVARHMQSDVGYSVQFSGGVDSSIVLALASNGPSDHLDTYSIRLPGSRFDESDYRKPVVERYKPRHHEYDFDGQDFADALPKALYHLEGPSAHMGCVLLMLLCQQISKTHKVVLTGEGADEFFGGYYRYGDWRKLRRFGRIGKIVPEPLWGLLHRYRYLRRYAHHEAHEIASVFIDPETLYATFPDVNFHTGSRAAVAGRFKDFRQKMFALDQTFYLDSLLLRQDKMSMASGVEARVPFTHYPLAKLLNSLPLDMRVPGGETKPLLKSVAEKWVPHEVVYRRKVGLGLPLAEWLKDENGLGRYLEFLTDPSSRIAGYGDANVINELVSAFRKDSKPKNVSLLVHLVNVEVWLRSLEVKSAENAAGQL